MLETCKRCLYPESHALGLVLDHEGVCSGCRVHEEKDRLDWGARWEKLRHVVAPYRSSTGGTYDCIVPVTGANDSYFIVHIVKKRLGLNPLLVTYNKYFNTHLGVRNLANLRIRFDCDLLTQNVDPRSVKKITRTTLRELGSIYWPCLAGQSVFPVQTAVRLKVPLIIWGAHQGLEQVGMFSHEHEVEMTRRYRRDHDLLGREPDDLLSIFDTLNEDDVWQYRYPDDADLQAVGVRGIYLGNYVRWDPKAQHEQMIREYGYCSAPFARTFDRYDHVDCANFMELHDLLKLYRHGYSKVLDHACREIRHGRITRSEALTLVRDHELQPPKNLGLFSEWLGILPRSLQFVLDQHRNPAFWTKTSDGKFAFKGISQQIARTSVTREDSVRTIHFTVTNEAAPEESRYITVGKGYP